MGASVVKTLLAVMGVAVMAVIGSPMKYAREPTWGCDNTTVQHNVTMRQVLGQWYLWDFYTPLQKSEEGCAKVTLTELPEEDGSHNRSFVNMTWHENSVSEPKIQERTYSTYFYKDNPGELFLTALQTVFRVRSLSADGGVLIMDACSDENYKFWMTLADKGDSFPPDVPRPSPSSPIYHRNAKTCLILTSSG